MNKQTIQWAKVLGYVAVLAAFGLASTATGQNAAPGDIVFVSERDGNPEIYSVKADGTNLTRLTNNPANEYTPVWSPDRKRIAFVSDRDGRQEIYVMNADGTNVVRRTFSATSSSGDPCWSPDGNRIVYSAGSNGSSNIWTVSPDSGSPALLLETPGVDENPALSPDGSRLAVASDWYAYDFVYDIFIANADGTGWTGLTDNIFDHVDYTRPSWSPDSAKLAVTIRQETSFDQYVYWLGVMNADGSELKPLISAAAWTKSSWSPDGTMIVFTSESQGALSISWVSPDGNKSGTIVTNGYSPDWGPAPTQGLPVPNAPSGLRATAVSASQIGLNWLDNSTDETNFVVDRSLTGSFSSGTSFTLPAGQTAFSDTNLAAATTYYYRVKATNANGSSPYSNVASATTPDLPVQPAPPTTTTIWPTTAVPAVLDSGPDTAVELGVTFRSNTSGYIKAIRFYKGPNNTGPHVGSLWTSTGTLLARTTFTNETASGWQHANLSTPVAITANTNYVASYFTTNGHFAVTQGYFASTGVTNGLLIAPANGAGALNGPYTYGSSSSFPRSTYLSSNYWVDVVFDTTLTPPPPPPPPSSSSYTIWPATAVPQSLDSGPDTAVELGVTFRSNTSGYITGVRFYKGPNNTGTHVGNLWTSAGTLLARATFTNETASGWQQVNFSTPVAITANINYVASYYTTNGHFAVTNNYFASTGVTNGPLTAPANGSGALNGPYTYGSTSAFPRSTYLSSNYWVDVVFSTTTGGGGR